jgi:hypothetical protein
MSGPVDQKAFPPPNVPLPEIGGGMDKTYHWHSDYPYWGWLEARTPDVRTRELRANNAIRTALPEARIPEIREQPTPILSFRSGSTVPARCGYWTQNINIRYHFGHSGEKSTSVKPQMMVFEVVRGFRNICETLAAGTDGPVHLQTLRADLEQWHRLMDRVVTYVGEVTLGIDRDTGKAFLLDLAAGTQGETAPQLGSIRAGLTNMIEFVDRKLSTLQRV